MYKGTRLDYIVGPISFKKFSIGLGRSITSQSNTLSFGSRDAINLARLQIPEQPD